MNKILPVKGLKPAKKTVFASIKDKYRRSQEEQDEINRKIMECCKCFLGTKANDVVGFMCENASIDEILAFVELNCGEKDFFSLDSWRQVFDTLEEKNANAAQYKCFFDVCSKFDFEKNDTFMPEHVEDAICEKFDAGELEKTFFRNEPCKNEKIFQTTVKKADLPILTQLLIDVSINDYDLSTKTKYATSISKAGVEKFPSASNDNVAKFVLEMHKLKLATSDEFEAPVKATIKKMMKENDDRNVNLLKPVIDALSKKKANLNELVSAPERARNSG